MEAKGNYKILSMMLIVISYEVVKSLTTITPSHPGLCSSDLQMDPAEKSSINQYEFKAGLCLYSTG